MVICDGVAPLVSQTFSTDAAASYESFNLCFAASAAIVFSDTARSSRLALIGFDGVWLWLHTVRGLTPASREAWVSETFSRRIFETTPRTRSQVSLNFSGFARYWASVRGAASLAFARDLLGRPLFFCLDFAARGV